ncbi:NADH:ubiquinone oxidoreductase complex I intermediate-associated protein 30 [Meredithblackwellia eburnea MCA 4105]
MAWQGYINRSIQQLREKTAQVVRAQPAPLNVNVLPLLRLDSKESIDQFAVGCDGDLGGKSTVHLDLGPEGKGRFWGSLSTTLREGRRKEGVIERGGYAGFRSKSQTTIFGARMWDTSLYDYLRLRVRSSGDGMRYFVNIQTDGPVRSDLFQHRLWLPSPSKEPLATPQSEDGNPHPHQWSDVIIPFSDFTLTNSGDLSELQIEMLRSKIRTVGISVLGPKEGRYELGIESIEAISKEEAGKTAATP